MTGYVLIKYIADLQYIALNEMISYMGSVFKVMYETSESKQGNLGVSPEELARVTAMQCFEEADLDKDGRLNFEEFKRWCTSSLT